MNTEELPSIDADEAFSEQGAFLLDVRENDEWRAGHAAMAVHIPIDELPHRYPEIKQTDHLIFVCQGGGRSAAAAEFMTSIGAFEIYNVLGGMSQWQGPKVNP